MNLKDFCKENVDKYYLLDEWDYIKNENFDITKINHSSDKKVWWTHKVNRFGKQYIHYWQATISKRTIKGTNCPYCANRLIIEDENSLQALYPEIASKWDYEKNTLKPSMVPPHSGKKYYFKCNMGHSFPCKITHMVDSKINCPICNQETKTSIPELAIYFYLKKFFPDAIKQFKEKFLGKKELDIFIPSLNIGIEYDGQQWHTDIKKDIQKNQLCKNNNITLYRIREPKCPILNDYSIDIYLNDLSNNELNIKIIELLKKLKIKEEFINVDIDRDYIHIINLGNFIKKENSLQILFPEITKEWDYEKNKNLTPEMVNISSHKKVYWKCKNNHSWINSISHRTQGESCPYCLNKKAWKGFNDIGTKMPELIKYWNDEQEYSNFLSKSGKSVNWKCPNCQYEWNEKIVNVSRRKNRCPNCSIKKS